MLRCAQEAKLLAQRVADEPRACGAAEPGWHAAFSLYRPAAGGGAARRRGAGTWNGVATLAREGLLLAAEPDPLGAPELDCEGRCLRTDHGEFVLFNVYAPTSGPECEHMAFKMRFFRALRRAMRAQRAAGRPVVLAGDLNLTWRREDVPWRERLVCLGRLFGDGGSDDGGDARPYDALPEALRAKLRGWRELLRGALASLSVEAAPPRGGAREPEAWRVLWRGGADAKPLQLGREPTRAAAERRWGLAPGAVTCPDPDDCAAPPLLLRRADCLALGRFADVAVKALGLPLSAAEQQALADVAEPPAAVCLVDWAKSLMSEDGMVDSFAAAHPHAQERFTCWEQYTNARYENAGARIDFIFVDAALHAARAARGGDLASGCGRNAAGAAAELDPLSAEAAAAAATAGARWKPAPFDGSGIPEPTGAQLETQFEAPGTGIRYMPPQYSDHTAITLLLADPEPPPPPLQLRLDAATLRAMPHKQTRSIKSFFQPRTAAAAEAAAPAAAAAAEAAAEGEAKGAEGTAANNAKKRPAAAPAKPLPPGQKSMRDLFGGRAQQP